MENELGQKAGLFMIQEDNVEHVCIGRTDDPGDLEKAGDLFAS